MAAFYQPKEIDLFASVRDRTCPEKSICAPIDKEILAMRILHAAEKGERDPGRLLQQAALAAGAFSWSEPS